MVMCVVIVLTAIVAGFAISMKTEMTLARNADYDNELEWMGRSGVELARYQLANKCAESRGIDALNQIWAGGQTPCSNGVENIPMCWDSGRGKFCIKIVDMERKWDINLVANPRAPQMEILQKAMQEVGVTDSEKASTIIDSIVDWISPVPDAHFSGAKSDYYLSLDPPYTCKNGLVDDLSELLLVKGMTPEIFWGSSSTNHPESSYHQSGGMTSDTAPKFRNDHPDFYPVGLQELFSPMGGKLNINTASAKTLALIPGIDEATAERIIQQRAGPDGQDGTEDDAPFMNPGEIMSGIGGMGGNVQSGPTTGVQAAGISQYVDVRSYVFEVHIDAQINGYARSFVGIVSRNGPSGNQLKCVRFYWEN
jgi:general secretion pathway protein K